MKKIKYGSRDKTKQKKNPFIEQLKDNDDDVCGAVLDSFSNQYLSYISGLVKASKTPSKAKMRTQERIQGLFQNKEQNDKKFDIKQMPINVVNNGKAKSKEVSPKSPKSYTDIKNSTLPLKHIKQLTQGNQTSQIRKQRDKGTGSVFQKINHYNPLKIDRNFNLKEHYNRFPTQQAQKIPIQQKFDQTSIECPSQDSSRRKNNLGTHQHSKVNNEVGDSNGKQFLIGLDEYLVTLESHRNFKKNQQKRYRSRTKNQDQIKTIEELYQENIKLRRRLQKYEQKMAEVELNMQNHFNHCKRQEKSQKTKIADLTQSLIRFYKKNIQQKQQLDQLKAQLKYFSKKAQHCAQKYEQQSSDGDDMNQELIKIMRPSRACSEYKLKKKNDFHFDRRE